MGSAYLAAGAGFTREWSLLQRNAEAGGLQHMPGLACMVTRRLSSDVIAPDVVALQDQQQPHPGSPASLAGSPLQGKVRH